MTPSFQQVSLTDNECKDLLLKIMKISRFVITNSEEKIQLSDYLLKLQEAGLSASAKLVMTISKLTTTEVSKIVSEAENPSIEVSVECPCEKLFELVGKALRLPTGWEETKRICAMIQKKVIPEFLRYLAESTEFEKSLKIFQSVRKTTIQSLAEIALSSRDTGDLKDLIFFGGITEITYFQDTREVATDELIQIDRENSRDSGDDETELKNVGIFDALLLEGFSELAQQGREKGLFTGIIYDDWLCETLSKNYTQLKEYIETGILCQEVLEYCDDNSEAYGLLNCIEIFPKDIVLSTFDKLREMFSNAEIEKVYSATEKLYGRFSEEEVMKIAKGMSEKSLKTSRKL